MGHIPSLGWPIGKNLIRASGLAVPERNECNVEAGLGFGRPIPRAMKCDEETTAVFGGKLAVGFEKHAVGRPMPRKRNQGFIGVGAAAGLFAVPAVFRGEYLLALVLVVKAIGPAEIIVFLNPRENFCRFFGAGLLIK